MNLIPSIIIYGFALSVILTTIILVTLYVNPRLLLQSYPIPIQGAVKGKTRLEQRQTKNIGILFMLLLIGLPVVSTIAMKQSNGGTIAFSDAFLNAFGIMSIFNIVDFLLIDWLIFCTITPRFLVIKGTEGMPDYKHIRYHVKGLFIGAALSLVFSLILASLTTLV